MRLLARAMLVGAVLLACLVCHAPLRARAAADTAVEVRYHGLTEDELLFLPAGGDPASLAPPAQAIVLPSRHTVEVEWDYAAINPDATGLQKLQGTLVEPEGVDFYKDGVHVFLYVSVEVVVYGPDTQVPLVIGRSPTIRGDSLLLPVGSTRQELDALLAENLDEQVMLMTEGGAITFTPYTVDPGKVDLNTRGAYWPYTIQLPPGITLADEKSEGMAVYVVDPNKVEMPLTARLTSGNSQVYSTWLYHAQDPVVEYIAMDELPDEDDEALWAVHGDSSAYETYSIIELYFLEPRTYYFRIRHREGVSDPLKVTTDGIYDPTQTGGDRDGGDTGIQDVPELTQPSPAAAQPQTGEETAKVGQPTAPKAGSGQTTVTERATDAQTAVSGLRLREMMALQPGGVLFQKGALSVWLDNGMLEALAFADDDLLEVRLEVTGPGRFLFEVRLNGEPLEALPDTRARLEYVPHSTQNLACVSEAGHPARLLSFKEESGLLEMVLDAPGHYAVTCDEPAQEALPTEPMPAAGPVAGPPAPGFGPTQAMLLGGGLALAVAIGLAGQRIWRIRRRAGQVQG